MSYKVSQSLIATKQSIIDEALKICALKTKCTQEELFIVVQNVIQKNTKTLEKKGKQVIIASIASIPITMFAPFIALFGAAELVSHLPAAYEKPIAQVFTYLAVTSAGLFPIWASQSKQVEKLGRAFVRLNQWLGSKWVRTPVLDVEGITTPSSPMLYDINIFLHPDFDRFFLDLSNKIANRIRDQRPHENLNLSGLRTDFTPLLKFTDQELAVFTSEIAAYYSVKGFRDDRLITYFDELKKFIHANYTLTDRKAILTIAEDFLALKYPGILPNESPDEEILYRVRSLL